jgi:hypothetical protein
MKEKKMETNYRRFSLVLLAVTTLGLIISLTGCATIITGKYQEIPVTSDPSGAKVRADTGETIITPGKFHLIRNESHILIAEYPGYDSQQVALHNKAQGWVWGNIIAGGLIGLVVDCSSGSSDELIPKEVHFNFVNPQLTTREAVKVENITAKNTEIIPDSNNYLKQSQAKKHVPTNSDIKVLHCGNCGREIGKLEKAYVYKGHIVCADCYAKLKNQP